MCVRPAPESGTPKPSQKGPVRRSLRTVTGSWALTDEGKPGRSCTKALRSGRKTMTRQVGMSSAFPRFYRVLESPEKRLRHSQVEAPVPWQSSSLEDKALLCVPAGPELASRINWLGTQDLSACSFRVLGSKGRSPSPHCLVCLSPSPCQRHSTFHMHYNQVKINDQ